MDPATRRAQIVDRATAIISRSGFQGFSIAELARECGISRAGVLHHFDSAEAVLVAVLRQRDLADAAAADDFVHVDSPAEMRSTLHRTVARNAGQREIVRLYTVLAAESLSPDHPAHAYFADRVSEIRQQVAATLTWHPDPESLLLRILATMDGLQLAWLRDPTIDLVAAWDLAAQDLLPDP